MKKLVLSGLILSSMHMPASWLGDVHQEFGMDPEDFAYFDIKDDVAQVSDRADAAGVLSGDAKKSLRSMAKKALNRQIDDIGIGVQNLKEYQGVCDERQQYAEQLGAEQGSLQGLASWMTSKLAKWNGTSLQHAFEYEQKEYDIDQEEIIALEKAYKVDIDGKWWGQLTTDEERGLYIQELFPHARFADDVNYNLLGLFASGFSYTQVKDYIAKMQDNAKSNHSKIITFENAEQAWIVIDQALCLQQINQAFNISELENNIAKWKNEFEDWLFPAQKKSITYHEAAHALVLILKDGGYNVCRLSTKKTRLKKGCLYRKIRSKVERNRLSYISIYKDHMYAGFKNEIMTWLAGGIGQQIYAGEKLTFHDFAFSGKYKGCGDQFTQGSDMHTAYQIAQQYILNKDIDIVFYEDLEKIQRYDDIIDPVRRAYIDQQVENFLEECYEQTYELLMKHKPLLDTLVQEAFKKEFVESQKIYKIVGKVRPKYDVELTPGEKTFKELFRWLSWTAKRMNVYQEYESGTRA
jgi:hypothetical protein